MGYYIYEEAGRLKDRISKEEFCRLYGMSKDKLYRFALYKLGDPSDAEDAVSDAVLKAWRDIDKLRDNDAFEAWIFSILRFTLINKISSYIRERERSEKIKAKELSQAAASFEPASLSTELTEALSILSDEERELVLLSVIGGFKGKEISDMTGLSAGTVRSKISRSLAKMREFLS